MTAPLPAATGSVGAPSYTFNSATKTGFYLAGANQIGWAANGVQGALFNSDTSIAFAGTVSAAKGTIPVGCVIDFAGPVVPGGWLLCYGQQVSTTTYAALFAVLGTLYGSGAGTFGIPDYRGRATFGQDNMGGPLANRITVAGGNFDGTVQGNSGGGQNQTLTLGQIPTGITSTVSVLTTSTAVITALVANNNFTFGNGGSTQNGALLQNNTASSTQLASTGTSTSSNTSGGSHTILSPAIITYKLIYAGV